MKAPVRTKALLDGAFEQRRKAIDASEVDGWFRASSKRGPWPKQTSCQTIAERLEQWRLAPSNIDLKLKVKNKKALAAARILIQELPGLEKDWREMRQGPAASLAQHFMPDAEIELSVLRIVLGRAVDYIDFPPSVVQRTTRKRWHALAFLVAWLAIDGMRDAGVKRISVEPAGPLVGFVMCVLARFRVEKAPGKGLPEATAVTSVLHDIPGLTRLRKS